MKHPMSSISSRPLEGIKVIDLTAAWAGPMATRSLAFLGAMIVKIESPAAIDPWRGTVAGAAEDRFPDFELGPQPFNRHSSFNTQNHDKYSIALNLKTAEGVQVVRDLAKDFDIVIANFSPGVLDRLGIGYSDLARENPQIIVIEMPAFGTGGPMTHHVGMGMTMEAATGMTSLMGYGDGRPVPTGTAYLDPIGGLHGAAAVLTALFERARTGRGQHIELAQTEAAMHMIGEEIIAAAEGSDEWTPRGNWVRDAAPHDAFRSLGDDEWVVIAAFDDAQWQSLCDAIGRHDLEQDQRFSSFSARWQNQELLGVEITRWTETRSKFEAAALLQGAGIPAAPVMNGKDIFEDQVLREIGFVNRVEHPAAGVHDYPGLAYRLSRTPGQIRQAAPLFAQHNDEVLREVLGYSAERVSEIRASGALVDWPTGYAKKTPKERSADD